MCSVPCGRDNSTIHRDLWRLWTDDEKTSTADLSSAAREAVSVTQAVARQPPRTGAHQSAQSASFRCFFARIMGNSCWLQDASPLRRRVALKPPCLRVFASLQYYERPPGIFILKK